MAETIQILLELDASKAGESFNKIGDQAKVVGGSIEKSIGERATASFGQLATGATIVTATIYAIKKSVDLVVDALKNVDQINQINAQFETLAKNAGQSASTLQSAFESASGGLLDTEDVLSSANKALVELGGFAQELPKLFELATAQTKIFGGEATSNFEAITRAVASGNAARLKGLGIFIDSTKAIEDFAKANGVSANALSEAGRQQAILNAVLSEGAKTISTAGTSQASSTIAITKLSVAIGEFGDAGSIAIEKVFGSVFRGAISYATTAISFYSDLLKNTFGDTSKLDQTNAKLAEQAQILKDQTAALSKNKEAYDRAGLTAGIEASIAVTQGKIKNLIVEVNKLKSETSSVGASGKPAVELFNKAILAEQKLGFEKTLSGLTASRIAAEQQYLSSLPDSFAKQEELIRLNADRILQIGEEASVKRSQLEDQASKDRVFKEQFLTEALLQVEAERSAKILAARQEQNLLLGQEDAGLVGSFQSVLDGANESLEQFAVNAQKNFKAAGASLIQFAGQAAGNAFASFGRALATGKNAVEAFASSLVASLGQAAIQLGTLFILQGTAYLFTADPVLEAKGPGLIASGAALAAIGGVLSAVGGGASGSSGGGGGSTGAGAFIPDSPALGADAVNKNQSRVTVNIQGDVLDSRDTGLRIVELIQSAFDTDGAQAVVT